MSGQAISVLAAEMSWAQKAAKTCRWLPNAAIQVHFLNTLQVRNS